MSEPEVEKDMKYRKTYRFEWENNETRTTENLSGDPPREAIEALAAFGEEDPECNVETTGFETLG